LFRDPPIDQLDFDFSHTVELVDRRSECQIEVASVRVDLFGPFRLGEGDRSQDTSMLSKSNPHVPFALAKKLSRFVQFDVACHQDRTWVSGTERSEAFDHRDRMEIQLLERSLCVDGQRGLRIATLEFLPDMVTERFSELRDLSLVEPQASGCSMATAPHQMISACFKGIVEID
jgi:hypothetical protein